MKKLLFVCGRNKLRSPTAEMVFNQIDGVEALSAGVDAGSETTLDAELIEWADIIFVMEPTHRKKLTGKFGKLLRDKRVVCLDIPDNYEYMDEELQRLLAAKVTPLI